MQKKFKNIAAFTHTKPLHVSFTTSLSSIPVHSHWSRLSLPTPLLDCNLALPSIQHAGGCQNSLNKGYFQPHESYYPEPSLENLYIYMNLRYFYLPFFSCSYPVTTSGLHPSNSDTHMLCILPSPTLWTLPPLLLTLLLALENSRPIISKIIHVFTFFCNHYSTLCL